MRILKALWVVLIFLGLLPQVYSVSTANVEEAFVIEYGHEIVLIEWSPTEDKIAVIGFNPSVTVDIFDTASGEKIAELPTVGQASGLVWSPDGEQLATLSIFGNLQIWDIEQQEVVSAFNIEEATGEIFEPGLSSDMDWNPVEPLIAFVEGTYFQVGIWNFSTGEYLEEKRENAFPYFATRISGISWTNSGDSLLISSLGCELAFVDPSDFTLQRSLGYDLLPYGKPIAPTG